MICKICEKIETDNSSGICWKCVGRSVPIEVGAVREWVKKMYKENKIKEILDFII